MSTTSPIPTTTTTWHPKAIVFDLLTALLDSWTLWNASTPSGTEAEGRRWREHYLAVTFGQGAYASYESLVKRAALESGLPDSAPENLIRNWSELQAWPEVATVLPALKRKGVKLGIVTNCSKDGGHVAVRRVEECVRGGSGVEVDGFMFDAAATAEESGFYKPVKAAYDAILPKLGVNADEVLFVAGSAGDVQGATEAGMRVVWHNRVGLAKKGEAVPLKEGKTLSEALRDFL